MRRAYFKGAGANFFGRRRQDIRATILKAGIARNEDMMARTMGVTRSELPRAIAEKVPGSFDGLACLIGPGYPS